MRLSQKLISFFVIILLFQSANIYASKSTISGKLVIDSTWNPMVYMSYIPNFREMNNISNNMIISEATLDSLGNFNIDISFLPEKDNLFRIHLVKKGNLPNTLIIGGKDENHLFFIANRNADIKITNNQQASLFENVKFEGYSDNIVFQQITNMVALSNEDIASAKSLSKKELIDKATSEKLRFIADTCKSPLVSLYALYKSNFESNYLSNSSFYKSYLKKWKDNHSHYFEEFRKQLPIAKNRIGIYLLISSFCLLLIASMTFIIIKMRKDYKLKKLSIQERKIIGLIQEGMTNQQISDECNIGLSTVKSHVSSIFSKLNVKSRKDILNWKNKNVC